MGKAFGDYVVGLNRQLKLEAGVELPQFSAAPTDDTAAGATKEI
jgi:hypothetical protein